MKSIFAFLFFSLSMTFAHAQLSQQWLTQQATGVIMRDLGLSENTNPHAVVGSSLAFDTQSEVIPVTLSFDRVPEFQIFLRGPKGFMQNSAGSLNSLMVVGGFFTGADSTKLLGFIPGTVMVGFNYPYSLPTIGQDPGKLLQTFRLTAPQIALALKYLSQQRWLKKDKFVVMGVSLGGLFLPTALSLAQSMKVEISHTVFAFTGSNLPLILENNLHGQVPPQSMGPIKVLIPGLNLLNNPQWHLPFLKGSFLVISSDQDSVVPRQASEELFSLLPAKKVQVLLSGGHINVDQPILIEQTKNAVLKWLTK